MDTNRPTKTITLPISKIEVQLKEWITGREFEAIQAPLYAQINVKPDFAGNVEIGNVPASVVELINKKTIEVFIVSVGGETKNCAEKILDCHMDDYNFVLAQIAEIRKKK